MTTIATELLQRHIETLVDDPARWETLIADDILWELAYAPSVGHPARLSGRDESCATLRGFEARLTASASSISLFTHSKILRVQLAR